MTVSVVNAFKIIDVKDNNGKCFSARHLFCRFLKSHSVIKPSQRVKAAIKFGQQEKIQNKR